ncbi:MAG: MOSC domain-containing protein [Rhodobacteraceae bacterium]|nr:MAG: MOSC domain-containing protein [Paracoccaceae bacterium]
MSGVLTRIERHPIKSHGRETLSRTEVRAGRTLPWDRHWAVLHQAATVDGSEWVPCANFSRGSKAPGLMAINAMLDPDRAAITLSHPDRPDLTFRPDDEHEQTRFLDWVGPLMPADRAASARIVSAGERGMTDTPFASISLLNLAGIRALSDRLGLTLDPRRFRGNFWIDGLAPWEEFGWIGETIRIGGVAFRVEERIKRCLATTANPETGRRDADTLGGLETGWGHRDMGVCLTALDDGAVAEGDAVIVA